MDRAGRTAAGLRERLMAVGRAVISVAVLPLRLIAWIYQPDERDRAGIGDARIIQDARERRIAWDRLQQDLAGTAHRSDESGLSPDRD